MASDSRETITATPDPVGRDEPAPASAAIDIAIELKGSVAVLEGVVLRARDRVRIPDLIESLDFVSRVENKLRPTG